MDYLDFQRLRAQAKQANVDLAAITTWEQALHAFPCPECQRRTYEPAGLVKVGHSMVEGVLYSVCRTCQPASTAERFRGRGTPSEVATRLIDNAYPVRWVWDWTDGGEVIDRADGTIITPADERDFDARDRLADLNSKWWATLTGVPAQAADGGR